MHSLFKTVTMQKYVKPVSELSKDILQFCSDFLIPVVIILVVYFIGFAIFFTVREHKKNKNELLAENENLFLLFLLGLGKSFLTFFANLPKILITIVLLFAMIFSTTAGLLERIFLPMWTFSPQ